MTPPQEHEQRPHEQRPHEQRPHEQAPTETRDPGDAGTPSAPATDGRVAFGRRRLYVVFAGLLLAIIMSALDQTVVATALPTIAGDLHGLNELSWVITAYLLAGTVTLPIYGKIGDLLGRKKVFVFSIVVFLVGSVLSGVAHSMIQLIVFRAVQGVGAGGIMIGAQAIIGEVVSARERGRYMSVMMPMVGIATVIGPLLGGFLTQHASWRWIFYINVPIGILTLVIVTVGLRLPRHHRTPAIDYWGTALLAAAASCVVLIASLGGTTFGWLSIPIVLLAAVAVSSVFGWVAVERRFREPVLPLRLFHGPIFVVSIGLSFAVGFAMIGAISYLPTFLQLVGGVSATSSGLLLLPLMAGLIATAMVTGQLISKTGRYKVFPILGTGASTIGLYLLSTMGVHTSHVTSSAYMVILGAGLGFVLPVLTLVVQNSVSFSDLGVATSGVNFFQQIGGAIGVSLAGTIFSTRFAQQLATQLPPALAHRASAHATAITPSVLAHLPVALRDGIVSAFAHSVPPIFLYFVPLLGAAFVLSWFLKEKPLSTRAHAAHGENGERALTSVEAIGEASGDAADAVAGVRVETEADLFG